MTATVAISGFSGPGGSTQGLKDAGIEHVIGVEYEETAVATAVAAGHHVVQADIRSLDPCEFFAKFLDGLRVDGFAEEEIRLLVQLSPPCQGLSMAGKGAGREDLEKLLEAVGELRFDGIWPPLAWHEAQDMVPALMEKLIAECSDDRSPLTFEVMRWIFQLSPSYVMLEQVPAALPIWEAIAEVLRSWGYSVWTGNVQAEQFGVPQTRKRAILLASCVSEMVAPVPTHSKYHNRQPDRLDADVLPWVSMAEALGWGVTDLVGFPRKYDGKGEAIEMDGELYRARDLREAGNPSFVVTEKARSWDRYVTHMGDVYNSKGCIRSIHEPAPTMTASMDNGNFQFFDAENAPPKTVDRLVARADATVATKSRNDGIRVTVKEAGILQGFDPEYPWVGTKTKQFQQVGNAVPPILQAALTRHVLTSN